MDRFGYMVDLRRRISEEISGVQNAGSSLFWDDTQPNWLTRGRLWELFAAARDEAEAFGVYVAVRHSDCGSRAHVTDYVMEEIGGTSFAYGDPAFVWSYPLDQGVEDRPCPCSVAKRTKPHGVIYDILFDKGADLAFCAALERILGDLHEAARQAGNKKPRSGIREHLLRALLIVNDQILPEPLDAYIAARGIT